MQKRMLPLVPTVLLAVSGLEAVENSLNTNIYQSGSNQHYLQGSLLLDLVDQSDYPPGGNSRGLWVRAEYGAKIELDDKIELTMTMAYNGRSGEKAGGASASDEGEVVLDDAWLVLKRFVHPSFDVELGRMPVSWNLRADHGGFLYDSRADDHALTSWDGVRCSLDLDNWGLRPFYYFLDLYNDYREAPAATSHDGENKLYGIVVDWQPESAVDNDIFITASYTIERYAWDGPDGAKLEISDLKTWYIGTEWKLTSGWDVYAEYAQQSGEIGDGRDIDASGYSGGAVWHIPVEGRLDRASLGLQYDHFDGDSGGSTFTGFINPHEAMADTLIVEHERYGELSELTTGNLEAYKTRFEWVFIPDLNMRLQAIGAIYSLPEGPGGSGQAFGQEYDVTFAWDYNYYSTISLSSGIFTADEGYTDLTGSDDDIYVFSASVLVEF